MDICSLIQPKITSTMAKSYNKHVSRDEVKRAVFQLGALKAPSSDGMSGIFF